MHAICPEEPAYQKARLCWSNYYLAGGATLNNLGNGFTNDACWRRCGTTAGCLGYQFNYYNQGECQLVSNWGNGLQISGNLVMPEIAPGINIYAMDNETCPDKNVRYTYFTNNN